jgi:hypothetical protein
MSRRARGLASLAQVGERQIEIGVMMGHQPHEIGRVRLAWPYRQHLPARHFGPVWVAGAPGVAGAFDCLGDIDSWGGFGAPRDRHGLGSLKGWWRPQEVQQLFLENTLRRAIRNSLSVGRKADANRLSRKPSAGGAEACALPDGQEARGGAPAVAVASQTIFAAEYASRRSFSSILGQYNLQVASSLCFKQGG